MYDEEKANHAAKEMIAGRIGRPATMGDMPVPINLENTQRESLGWLQDATQVVEQIEVKLRGYEGGKPEVSDRDVEPIQNLQEQAGNICKLSETLLHRLRKIQNQLGN